MTELNPKAMLHQELFDSLEEAEIGIPKFFESLRNAKMRISGKLIFTVSSYDIEQELKKNG